MKIRVLFKLCCIFIFVCETNQIYSQYSDYYRVDINKNVKSDVSVRGHITTIDYGQLARANAENEKIRLEKQKFQIELNKEILLKIANNPIEAFNHGWDNIYNASGQEAKVNGFKRYTTVVRVPHESMFIGTAPGVYENISSDGIRAELWLYTPQNNIENMESNVEKILSYEEFKIGQENEGLGIDGGIAFLHKKDLNRTNVYGLNGFRGTLIWEDNYQLYITDHYYAYDKSKGNGIFFIVKCRYSVDKDNSSFEDLEGRRYYLLPLIDKVASTAIIKNERF